MPAAKPLAEEHIQHIIRRRSEEGRKVAFTQIAAELSILRGAGSAYGVEKRKRMVSAWTVRQVILAWENGDFEEYAKAPQDDGSENVIVGFDERHPVPQLDSPAERVASATPTNAEPGGVNQPRSDEHDGKVA